MCTAGIRVGEEWMIHKSNFSASFSNGFSKAKTCHRRFSFMLADTESPSKFSLWNKKLDFVTLLMSPDTHVGIVDENYFEIN